MCFAVLRSTSGDARTTCMCFKKLNPNKNFIFIKIQVEWRIKWKRLGADKPGPKSSAAASRVHCPRWIVQLDKPWRVTGINYEQQKKEQQVKPEQ